MYVDNVLIAGNDFASMCEVQDFLKFQFEMKDFG